MDMNNEPVAWRTHYPSGWEYKDGNPPFELKENSQLLYTHPHSEESVKAKSLTDEEIEELWYDPRFIGDPVAFGKAVLRAAKNIPLQTDEEICKKCDALTERAILRKAKRNE